MIIQLVEFENYAVYGFLPFTIVCVTKIIYKWVTDGLTIRVLYTYVNNSDEILLFILINTLVYYTIHLTLALTYQMQDLYFILDLNFVFFALLFFSSSFHELTLKKNFKYNKP